MAQDQKKGKNFWEDDEDEDEDLSSSKSSKATPGTGPMVNVNDTAHIDQRLREAKLLMEQTHQLYQQFFGGIEKRAPIEKVRLLQNKVAELQRTSTTITTSRFKITQFLTQYGQMKDLWERKLRERERK